MPTGTGGRKIGLVMRQRNELRGANDAMDGAVREEFEAPAANADCWKGPSPYVKQYVLLLPCPPRRFGIRKTDITRQEGETDIPLLLRTALPC